MKKKKKRIRKNLKQAYKKLVECAGHIFSLKKNSSERYQSKDQISKQKLISK